ncbi:hypothetical protein VitviT2T_014989 [Vitis vinifera]|nr:F-box protein At1g61340 [Vitis vinifera]WJZ96290.1 hypothetical protein VitviT2T_014989 [Vitis vinifera]|eukprot:XP_003634996.1 PREDICTED: F-box protein At1g61340-like [Vitis vinifera]
MALGRRHGSQMKGGDEELGLGFAPVTRSLSRKRILVSSNTESSSPSSVLRTPLKRRCGEMVEEKAEKSMLEAMPQDILIRILCGVDHDDLKQLFHVSNTIRDATLIAKKSHFAYSTPSKVQTFRSPLDPEESSGFDDLQTPDAPKQSRHFRSRLRGRKLSGIAIALFSSDEE